MKRVSSRDRCYNTRPVQRMVNPHKLRAHIQELAYLQSRELVTPCRLFLILIGSIIMVMLISFSIDSGEYSYEVHYTERINISSGPYVFDHQSMQQTREEMLGHYGYQSGARKVEKRSELSINEFWDLYDGKWPVIVTDIVPKWNAYKHWGKDFFIQKFGADKVILKAVQGQLQEGVAHIRDLKTFISYLEQPSGPRAWTYMEDEMFLMLRPELKEDIGSNYLMDENFFSLFPTEIRPWDCMLLWGTKYSRSPLHMDPYNWTAISAVIWGRKLWKLYPPGQDQFLYIAPKEKCGFPLECNKYNSPIDMYDVDYWKYPKARRAEYIEVEQNSGELLIIPTGWYHQAYNDEETLSVSMQLMNRNNYLAVLEEIIKGKNLSRKKLPPHFSTLLPPDQVKLFMSLLPQKVLKYGREVTDSVMKTLDNLRNSSSNENPGQLTQ